MDKQIHDEILKIKSLGLSNIYLLALVTDSSYEVVFYAHYNGELLQSNKMTELGIIPFDIVEKIYLSIANIVRKDKKFKTTMMNILKYSNENISFEYDEKKCRVYKLKKKWKESIENESKISKQSISSQVSNNSEIIRDN